MFTPPLRCRDPVAIGPRWIMPDMLLMPAFQISHPIQAFVLMKTNNLSWNPRRSCLRGLHVDSSSLFETASYGDGAIGETVPDATDGLEVRFSNSAIDSVSLL